MPSFWRPMLPKEVTVRSATELWSADMTGWVTFSAKSKPRSWRKSSGFQWSYPLLQSRIALFCVPAFTWTLQGIEAALQGQGGPELKWQDALEVPGRHSAHPHRRGAFLKEGLGSSSRLCLTLMMLHVSISRSFSFWSEGAWLEHGSTMIMLMPCRAKSANTH